MAAGLPIKVPRAAKVHPCNINDDDPRLRTSRRNGPHDSVAKCALTLAASLASLLMLSGMIFTFMWFTFRARNPTLRIDSLFVPRFDTSNSTLAIMYDVRLTYINPNNILKIDFDEIEVSVFYKRDYTFAGATVEPFNLGTKEEKSLNIATLGDEAHWFREDPVVEEIRRDREKGTVGFDFLIRSTITFKGRSWWLWWKGHGIVAYSCSRLEVDFVNATGAGSLRGGVPKKCYEVG